MIVGADRAAGALLPKFIRREFSEDFPLLSDVIFHAPAQRAAGKEIYASASSRLSKSFLLVIPVT